MQIPGPDRALWLAKYVLPYEPMLRNWLARRRIVGIEIDDIVQETYAVLASLERVSHIKNPRSYMFQTAHSLVLQQLRRSRLISIQARADLDRLDLPADIASPEQLVADQQELRRIAELIATLPAKCREAFMLRKIHGLSQQEIARHMGISENTVEKHLGKGLRFLVDAMGRGGRSAAKASRQIGEDGHRQHDQTGDKRQN